MVVLDRKGVYLRLKKFSEAQKYFLSTISIKALSALTLSGGAMLIIGASLPDTGYRLSWLSRTLPPGFIQFSRVTTLGIGLLLIVLSKGIWDKVISSYYITMVTLIVGAGFALLRAFNFELSLILLAIVWAPTPPKGNFFR